MTGNKVYHNIIMETLWDHSPPITRGRYQHWHGAGPAWQTRHKTWHLAWHVMRPRLGKSLRQILWQGPSLVWCWLTTKTSQREWLAACVNVNILCLGDPLLVGKLKYFPIHPKRLWQLVKYWVEMFIFHLLFPLLWMTCVMQDRRKQLISVTPEWCRGHHLSLSGVITSWSL